MRRTLLLFAACALLLAHGAHAACKADKPDADPVSGCAKCSKDGKKCLECSERFGLTADGTCVRCTVPGYFGDKCSKCDGDKPDICLTCSASCGRRSCLGLFASEGRCEPCSDSCADCNAKGQCLACQRFYGLVNGTCQHCKENCYSCGDDASKCESCTSGYDCKDEKTCNSCDFGYGPSKKGAKDCVPCKSTGCTGCYDDSAKCTSCDTGFGLVKDACVACAAANCTNCDGDAKVCTSCSSNDTVSLGTDKATGGCAPCKDANCQTCTATDACNFCKDGFGLDEKAGTCKPCPEKATSCTFNATGTFVDACANGYGPDKAGKECKACGVDKCDRCDKLGAGFCDVYGCAEGYGYSDQENVCFACKEGCASCTETSCSYCLSGYAFADSSEKACTKCVDGDKRGDCQPVN
ncbi:hypothetical protein COHA_001091 [Chlorella ohadii]|uniref:EGF-like domain-containing protein n=1 Tax=Chlorella ohadii TaxID=2649997 RepID=A0AAD5DZR3_9CHLO|nr:hypothetical protein COHA_001091 [Chlorella ohadii]